MRAALCLLLLTTVAAADEPREVTRAKEAYLKTVNKAEDQLIEQLEDAAATVAKDGQIELAIQIRDEIHQLRFGEWVPATEGPGPESLQSARRQFMEAAEAARGELATAMEAGVKSLGGDGQLTEARQMADQIEELKSGRWEPSGLAELAMPAHYVSENGGRAWPVDDPTAPDELKVAFSRSACAISGSGTIDTMSIEGKRCGHFGKAIVFRNRRAEGLLKVGASPGRGGSAYAAGFLRSGKLEDRVFLKLSPGATYRWSFQVVRGKLHFELREGDAVISELSAPGTRDTLPAFAATVRRPGDKADIKIAVD